MYRDLASGEAPNAACDHAPPRGVSVMMIAASDPLRVVVGDAYPLFLASIARSVSNKPGLALAGIATDGARALALIRGQNPAVAVLEMQLPGLDGQQVLDAIIADGLGTRVLFLSERIDGATVHQALASGASGYLSKDADEAEIQQAILSAGAGDTVVSARVNAALLQHLRLLREHQQRPRLSARELETLSLTSRGLSVKSIALKLSLSPHTVHTNLRRVYEKLGVCNQAGAVGEAMRQGILQ